MFLINGQKTNEIAVTDRGLHYGDGVFETIEVFQSKLVFIDEHLQRLVEGCSRLKLGVDIVDLTSQIVELARQMTFGVIKVIVTRGSGGRGYQSPRFVVPTVVIGSYPFPNYPEYFQQQGVVATLCEQRLGVHPNLSGIKHLNRLEQVLARLEWTTDDYQEGIMLDAQGYLVEGTMSNLFWVKQRTLYTPDLTDIGILGIMRAFVLSTAQTNYGVVQRNNFTLESLFEADEVFVTNSIIGIWPIRQFVSHSFCVGEVTRWLQSCLSEYKQQLVS